MTDYSPRSQELARELRKRAIDNLQRAGYTARKSDTGRYVVTRGPRDKRALVSRNDGS